MYTCSQMLFSGPISVTAAFLSAQTSLIVVFCPRFQFSFIQTEGLRTGCEAPEDQFVILHYLDDPYVFIIPSDAQRLVKD